MHRGVSGKTKTDKNLKNMENYKNMRSTFFTAYHLNGVPNGSELSE